MRQKSLFLFAFSFLFVLVTFGQESKSYSNDRIHVYCNESNDLFQLLKSNGQNCIRYNDINSALENSKKNDVLLILAKNYPEATTMIPSNFFKIVSEKNLKTYIEFPDHLESGISGEIKSTKKERLVVTSDFFGEELPPMSILDAGLYFYIDTPERDSHLKGASIAGFDKAVYGLEKTKNSPILFEDRNVLVSTTKLSDFNKSRYSPLTAWQSTIRGILSYLSIEMEKEAVKWDPIVKPSYNATVPLPENAYKLAVERGAEWYKKARFLIHPDWKDQWQSIDTLKLPVGPPMDLNLPSGDGSLGVMEGHYSYINYDGSQPYRYWLRGDCVAETAMTFAMADDIKENGQNEKIAENLMDFLYNTDIFKTSSSKDPKMSSYGLVGWAATQTSRYYGDDNARILLGSILSSQLMENNKWNVQILELILANFRTSGKNGFRGGALNGKDIDKKTWQTLMQGKIDNIAPHYESWIWATYLWLYDKTGYQPLLDKAKTAIEITMNNYPKNWTWTNGIQQERARMILPLAWLVRIEDTDQHRDWLNTICDDLLKSQVEAGALREELGEGSKGRYGAPKSNESYGHAEAPVIHSNGDPVADMLYTSNFAFFALNEAAQATQNPRYIEAVDKLAEFMVRIQSTSSGRADLDGCWFRAFDYENWEYYGSNADHGWGAWGTLTGWTQSFITTTLALKLKKTSYWDITKDSGIGDNIDIVWSKMLPGIEH
ncbi:hypothetical protein DHD32_01730 [Arenibacter sp. TNZ]|uniref:hypothetical protein n=1 Tax=Arenibacter TaxID=178469 RepID=UPI000CD48D48|nr:MULTISPECIES: hypothetical protein [Arenibacter]MCM4170183.1 hypothetical protein [Arenibacter sp. TNZ]